MSRPSKLRCPRCDRTFRMPAHLGRHMKAIHGRTATAARRASRAPQGPRPRRRALVPPSAYSMPDLETALGILRTAHAHLTARRAELDGRIAVLDEALAALDGSPAAGGTPGRRAKAGGPVRGSLKEFIQRVLRADGGPMQVSDIARAVLDAGFRTRDKSLAHSVGAALRHMPGVKKVGCSVYRVN